VVPAFDLLLGSEQVEQDEADLDNLEDVV